MRRVASLIDLKRWLSLQLLSTFDHTWKPHKRMDENGNEALAKCVLVCVKFLLVCSSIYSLGASFSTLGSWSNGCIQTSLHDLNLTLGSWSSGGVQTLMSSPFGHAQGCKCKSLIKLLISKKTLTLDGSLWILLQWWILHMIFPPQ